MNSILPSWVLDISSISSIIGLVVTIFLLIEAKKIKNSFLRRARLPEITKDLNTRSKNICSGLKSWSSEKNQVNMQYAIVRGLLENIATKLPEDERAQVVDYINSLKERSWFFWWSSLLIESEDKGWKLYTELGRIITRLEQLQKDSRWD